MSEHDKIKIIELEKRTQDLENELRGTDTGLVSTRPKVKLKEKKRK